jgi:hypothetical protein
VADQGELLVAGSPPLAYNLYIGFHLLSDDPLAYSVKSLSAAREGKTLEARRAETHDSRSG